MRPVSPPLHDWQPSVHGFVQQSICGEQKPLMHVAGSVHILPFMMVPLDDAAVLLVVLDVVDAPVPEVVPPPVDEAVVEPPVLVLVPALALACMLPLVLPPEAEGMPPVWKAQAPARVRAKPKSPAKVTA
jgi:hypothetical protein